MLSTAKSALPSEKRFTARAKKRERSLENDRESEDVQARSWQDQGGDERGNQQRRRCDLLELAAGVY